MDVARANHVRHRGTDLCCAHRSSKGNEHPALGLQMATVPVGGVEKYTCVEVPKVTLNERGDGRVLHRAQLAGSGPSGPRYHRIGDHRLMASEHVIGSREHYAIDRVDSLSKVVEHHVRRP